MGGNPVRADVRIVATNRDIAAEVERTFPRGPLLPSERRHGAPLQARREDIPLLVDHFLGVPRKKNGRARLVVLADVMRKLTDIRARQRAREQNVVERAALALGRPALEDQMQSRRRAPDAHPRSLSRWALRSKRSSTLDPRDARLHQR